MMLSPRISPNKWLAPITKLNDKENCVLLCNLVGTWGKYVASRRAPKSNWQMGLSNAVAKRPECECVWVCVCVDVDIMCCWFSKQRTNTNDAFTAMRTTTMVDEDGRRRQRQHTCTIGVWMAPAEQFPVCVCVYIALQMTHTKRISAYCCVVYIRVCVSLCHCVSGMDVDGAVKFAK